jgi:hypothetical protein
MVRYPKSIGALVLRVVVVLALLGCPQIGSAAGTWSVISLPQKPGEVTIPTALAVDAVGNLYVADGSNGSRIQKRVAHGDWSVIAAGGSALGQVNSPTALAVDTAGSLYVVDSTPSDGWGRIQKRDARGNCYENRTPGPVQAHGTPTAPRLSEAIGR